jgi:hypothetical protein
VLRRATVATLPLSDAGCCEILDISVAGRFSPRPFPAETILNSGCLAEFSTAISGFRRDVDEICALLRCYAAASGNPVPKFRDNVLVPSSRGKKSNEANS